MRRLLCIGLALLLAGIVGRDAALAYWRSAAPGSAPQILASDPALRLRAADSLMADPVMLRANAQAIRQAATDLLRQAPLDSAALRKLAITESLRRPGAWQGFVTLAERVSRRDLPSELLLIDAAAEKGNVVEAIRHYDHVLSVLPEAKQKLFPLLSGELADPAVRAALVPLASRPWLRDFILNAIDYDVAPADLMDFYGDLTGRVPVSELQAGTVRIIRWLYASGQGAYLGDYASRVPGIAPQAFDPLGFTAITLDPALAPLSWDLPRSDAVETELDGQKLTIRVTPEGSGSAAMRLTWLKPGSFDISQTVAYFANSPRAQLHWRVTCLDSNQTQLLQQALPQENAGAPFVAHLTVPAGCLAQAWQLQATAGRSQTPSEAQIANLTLVRK